MSREIKKLFQNQKNTHKIIDYVNNIIKDLDIQVNRTKTLGTQIVVPTCLSHKKIDKKVLQFVQFASLDKVMVTIKSEYSGSNDDRMFTFWSLEEL